MFAYQFFSLFSLDLCPDDTALIKTPKESSCRANLARDLVSGERLPFLASSRKHIQYAIDLYSLKFSCQKIGVEELKFLKDCSSLRVLEIVNVLIDVELVHNSSSLLGLNLECWHVHLFSETLQEASRAVCRLK